MRYDQRIGAKQREFSFSMAIGFFDAVVAHPLIVAAPAPLLIMYPPVQNHGVKGIMIGAGEEEIVRELLALCA